jgi:hypothetical protein
MTLQERQRLVPVFQMAARQGASRDGDLAGLLDGPACRDTLDPMTLRF